MVTPNKDMKGDVELEAEASEGLPDKSSHIRRVPPEVKKVLAQIHAKAKTVSGLAWEEDEDLTPVETPAARRVRAIKKPSIE